MINFKLSKSVRPNIAIVQFRSIKIHVNVKIEIVGFFKQSCYFLTGSTKIKVGLIKSGRFFCSHTEVSNYVSANQILKKIIVQRFGGMCKICVKDLLKYACFILAFLC